MKKIMLLIGLAALSGCATQNYYAQTVCSWRGKSEANLIRVWGYPSKIIKTNNGNNKFIYGYNTYGRNSAFISSAHEIKAVDRNGKKVKLIASPSISSGGMFSPWCNTWFEINSYEKVIDTGFSGNACTATKQFAIGLWGR